MSFPVVVLVGLMTITSCTIRRPEAYEPECRPLTEPLTVQSGAITIDCAVKPGLSLDLDCTIRDRSGAVRKSGNFMLADPRPALGFDPKDPSSFASWDGCFVIRLRDGGRLEEIEII